MCRLQSREHADVLFREHSRMRCANTSLTGLPHDVCATQVQMESGPRLIFDPCRCSRLSLGNFNSRRSLRCPSKLNPLETRHAFISLKAPSIPKSTAIDSPDDATIRRTEPSSHPSGVRRCNKPKEIRDTRWSACVLQVRKEGGGARIRGAA